MLMSHQTVLLAFMSHLFLINDESTCSMCQRPNALQVLQLEL